MTNVTTTEKTPTARGQNVAVTLGRHAEYKGDRHFASKAKFAPGSVIRHKLFGYIGLIFDVDACYSQSDKWYDMMAKSSPSKNKPWYYVIVDGESHTTYVAEEHLMTCQNKQDIDHPMVSELFERQGGSLQMRATLN